MQNKKKTCMCNSYTSKACGNCSRLRMVFLMRLELGNIRNPVYYSFQAEDKKYKEARELALIMFKRLMKLHKDRFFKVEVYDNQVEGKPKLFEFKQEYIQ